MARGLIDLTDAKFMIPANQAVVDFIRRASPFAHSDIGSKLIELGAAIPGAVAYCPDYKSCAYVVLHDDANVIFAIAEGMRLLSFRLPEDMQDAAIADGAAPSRIGDDWVSVAAFDKSAPDRAKELSAAAYRYARRQP
jgi:hypothetical protein